MTMEQTRREAETERFGELISELGHEPKIRALLMAILEAKAAPDDQQAQAFAVSHHLAEVLENDCTPERIFNEIVDGLISIEDTEGNTQRDLRAGFYVSDLINTTQKDKSKEGKANGKA